MLASKGLPCWLKKKLAELLMEEERKRSTVIDPKRVEEEADHKAREIIVLTAETFLVDIGMI
jgi:hypothetical protein